MLYLPEGILYFVFSCFYSSVCVRLIYRCLNFRVAHVSSMTRPRRNGAFADDGERLFLSGVGGGGRGQNLLIDCLIDFNTCPSRPVVYDTVVYTSWYVDVFKAYLS